MTWQLGSMLVLVAALAGGFAWYERSRPPARVLALVAALAALAAIGRVAFAAFPNVKPTSDIVLFSGFALGGPAGFAVGALAALVSNIFLGQGPWTPWQMAAWGTVGALGALLGRLMRNREPSRLVLALACGAAGFLFGALMDLYQWTLAAEHTLASYLAISGTSLTFNIAHAVGNVVFALLLGPAFVRALQRYRRRFEVRWVPRPAPAATAGVVLALLVLGAGGQAPAVEAAEPPPDVAPAIGRAVHYLRFSQNSDGGFGADRGQGSTQLHTGWSALGLASANRNPLDVARRGNSIVDYMKAHVGQLDDTGELERTLLVLRAAGRDHRLGNRNLLARLLRRQRGDGSFGTVNLTAFGVLALRAAGRTTRSREVRAAARWLLRAQNRDGGYGFTRAAASDVDDTGAVLQALAAAGRRTTPVVDRAVRYLRRVQRPDGGFAQMAGGESNAQSTSWAIQGLVAARRDPRRLRRTRTPIQYLKSLQAADGSVRYSRTSTQTPVWVTAQALMALEAKPLPLRPAPRRRARTAARAANARGPEPAAADAPKPSVTAREPEPEREPDSPAEPERTPPTREPPPTVDAQPAASTTSETAPGHAEAADGGGPSTFEITAFAVVLVLLTVGGLGLAWRRG